MASWTLCRAAILAAPPGVSRMAGSIVLIVAVAAALLVGTLPANTYRHLADPIEGYGVVPRC